MSSFETMDLIKGPYWARDFGYTCNYLANNFKAQQNSSTNDDNYMLLYIQENIVKDFQFGSNSSLFEPGISPFELKGIYFNEIPRIINLTLSKVL